MKDDEHVKRCKAYQLASKCTKSTRLVEFQFKLLHERIATNQFLNTIYMKDDSNCSFYGEEPESLQHLFWSCPKVICFWNAVSAQLIQSRIITESYAMNITVSLGITPDSSKNHHQINFCCLLARYYICICKNKETIPKNRKLCYFA